ncbi:MAG: 50S ribosomal protein L21 [Bacteroidales bacterium]|nr:50S ribosomal protein L21 [Bacteroidales bacterium]
MYAIVEIAGQQFKVEEGKNIFVHRLDAGEGETLKFEQVLLVEEDGKISIGEPTVKDAFVEGKILGQVKGDKVIVFKKKRKKGYRVKNGHRQNFTSIEIISINGKSSPKKVRVKKEEVKAEKETEVEAEVTGKKAEAKKRASSKKALKEAEEKKKTVKKAVVKKAPEKKAASKKSSKGKK